MAQGKYNIADMHTIAESHGGKCLSKLYKNTTIKLEWQCAEGHQWFALPGNIIHNGSWCDRCWRTRARKSLPDAQQILKPIEEVKQSAKSRGGLCLSSEYIDMTSNLLWACGRGHTWKANHIHINSGYWCPICATER